jgi:2-polyprenyl-3-methyl-5-hydroxy-6-metoxy-1,4-benzoquinol methylase
MQYKKNQPSAHSADHFGEARSYWWNEDFLALMAERLSLSACRSAADIGCGTGEMTFRLASYLHPQASITGLDREETHLKTARQRARHRKKDKEAAFSFVAGDADALPFADEQFELTFCQTLLIHTEDPLQAIREMKRVTATGGYVVALEPNNLVSHLMFDRYAETDYDVDSVLEMVEVRLRCEQGKKNLGQGFNSLGDVLPDLFGQAGLTDVQVWQSDKALSLIPPYDTREKRVRAAQLVDWLENDEGGLGYDENLRYHRAGGGKKATFDTYWQRVSRYKVTMLRALKEQQYISAGGQMMYLVAGVV